MSILVCRMSETEVTWSVIESQHSPSWEGPTRIIKLNSQPCKGPPQNLTTCPRVLSKHFLNSVRLGAVTTALSSLFQCWTTLSVKNLFLISSGHCLASLQLFNWLVLLWQSNFSPHTNTQKSPF